MKEIDNRKFYDANDAYQMAKKIQEENEQNELKELFDKIDSYVRVAEYECNFIELSDFQNKWLEDHGYNVSKINKPNHYTHGMFKVSWNKK